MLTAVISPVDPVHFFSDRDHLKTKPAAPDDRPTDSSARIESIQDALALLARFSVAIKTVGSTSGTSSRSESH